MAANAFGKLVSDEGFDNMSMTVTPATTTRVKSSAKIDAILMQPIATPVGFCGMASEGLKNELKGTRTSNGDGMGRIIPCELRMRQIREG